MSEKKMMYGLIPDFGIIAKINGIPFITYYGVFCSLGLFFMVVFACIKAKRFYKLNYDVILKLAPFCFIVSVISASIWSFIIGNSDGLFSGINSGLFINDFTKRGGLAIQGGIIGGILFSILYLKHQLKKYEYWIQDPLNINVNKSNYLRPSIWIFLDLASCLLLAQTIGRWGNFFNYEIFGKVVSNITHENAIKSINSNNTSNIPLNWLRILMPGVWNNMWFSEISNLPAAKEIVTGVTTTVEKTNTWTSTAKLHHPLFLYESIFSFSGWVFSYFFINWIKGYRTGISCGFLLIWNGIFRAATEELRHDNFKFIISRNMGILFIIIGFLIILYTKLFLGHTKFRKLDLFGYIQSYWLQKFYRYEFFCNISLKGAHFMDKITKKKQTKIVYQQIKKLKKEKIVFADYYLSQEYIYYGANYQTKSNTKQWLQQ